MRRYGGPKAAKLSCLGTSPGIHAKGTEKDSIKGAIGMIAGNVKNVTMQVSGDILTIQVDLSKRLGPSSSGKSTLIASHGRGSCLDSGEKVNLCVYRSNNSEYPTPYQPRGFPDCILPTDS
jgi:hypothetical protein